MHHPPQKLLTLQLTGRTSVLEVGTTVQIDVTSALHWFLLYHSVSATSLTDVANERVIVNATDLSAVIHTRKIDAQTERFVRETTRFASKTNNIKQLLRLLSLKQIDEVLKNPLTYRRLIEQSPATFTSTRWFEEGKPDLVTLGIVPGGF